LGWYSITVVSAGLLIGIPAGLVASLRIWSLLTNAIGVIDAWSVPWLIVLLVLLSSLTAALLLAVVPGHIAARTSPSKVLRRE
jgi:hypothetical protein